MTDIQYLKILACEFRVALEYVVEKRLYGRLMLFREFPRACCGYTSNLLAEYMMSKGIAKERIQTAECETIKERYTHCWLLIDNAYYVDITADQFNGKSYFKEYEPIPSCCVISCDEQYLYERFVDKEQNLFSDVGINAHSSDISEKLQIIYNAAIQYIENSLEEN